MSFKRSIKMQVLNKTNLNLQLDDLLARSEWLVERASAD